MPCIESSTTNKIYCFGGASTGGALFDQILEYDPILDTLVIKNAHFSNPRQSPGCINDPATDLIYCLGGVSYSNNYLNEITEFNPLQDMLVTKTTVLPTPKGGRSCATNSATTLLYCFGGGNSDGITSQIIEYNPGIVTDIYAWTQIA